MSAENVELVQRWFERLAQGDFAPEFCHPEIVIRNWDEAPIRGPYHGHAGMRQWWADFADVLDDVRLELKEAIDLGGDRVVTSLHIVGRFRLTGIDVNGPFGSIVTVRDGKILSAIGYASPGLAKKAAGLKRPSACES
jgi:ketosteroid isomerase-like protein